MKVGEIELRVPQERSGQFSTRVFECYRRSEKALVAVLSEMYVQGVSTRRVSRLAEDLCGYEFVAGDDLDHGIEAGCVPEGVCGTSAGGGVSVRGAGCPV